ncbi:hypothetical protein [Lyngbya aestuarii]|uniref:hypothetical protein n=1 Tax=Lyngbya aestuarii TaxID=118322 RepID=UPI00403D7967
MNIPEEVTFEDAISFAQSLVNQMAAGDISQPEAAEAIASLVKSKESARGFFATYLTSEGTLADHPSPEIIQALQSSPETVAGLLVKNLAMSAAMAVAHRRDNNEEMAQGSDRVRLRTTHLIEKVELPQLREQAEQLRESAVTGEGNYKAFLQRWEYDAQQREVICQALDRVIFATNGENQQDKTQEQ